MAGIRGVHSHRARCLTLLVLVQSVRCPYRGRRRQLGVTGGGKRCTWGNRDGGQQDLLTILESYGATAISSVPS